MSAGTVGMSDKWMKGSPLKGALLSLLLELGEPMYPYRLAMLLAERLGPALRVEVEGVYKMLLALENAGLVAHEVRESADTNVARQRVYRPTVLTEPAVGVWMAAPLSDVAARPELLVKIAFARRSDIPVLLNLLGVLEMRCTDRLDECQSAEAPVSSWIGLATNVACGWAEEHLHAELRWIMSTRDRLREYATRHDAIGL